MTVLYEETKNDQNSRKNKLFVPNCLFYYMFLFLHFFYTPIALCVLVPITLRYNYLHLYMIQYFEHNLLKLISVVFDEIRLIKRFLI